MDKHAVVCICGSSRLQEAVKTAVLAEEDEGKIVLYPRYQDNQPTEAASELHYRKIDLADEVLGIHDGHLGEHVAQEVAYAQAQNKPIRYLAVEQ